MRWCGGCNRQQRGGLDEPGIGPDDQQDGQETGTDRDPASRRDPFAENRDAEQGDEEGHREGQRHGVGDRQAGQGEIIGGVRNIEDEPAQGMEPKPVNPERPAILDERDGEEYGQRDHAAQ